jgi:hypothetical protein
VLMGLEEKTMYELLLALLFVRKTPFKMAKMRHIVICSNRIMPKM